MVAPICPPRHPYTHHSTLKKIVWFPVFLLSLLFRNTNIPPSSRRMIINILGFFSLLFTLYTRLNRLAVPFLVFDFASVDPISWIIGFHGFDCCCCCFFFYLQLKVDKRLRRVFIHHLYWSVFIVYFKQTKKGGGAGITYLKLI